MYGNDDDFDYAYDNNDDDNYDNDISYIVVKKLSFSKVTSPPPPFGFVTGPQASPGPAVTDPVKDPLLVNVLHATSGRPTHGRPEM